MDAYVKSSKQPTIHNIKFHFKLDCGFNYHKHVRLHNLKSKCWGNYYTFKLANKKKPAFSFFPKSKFVNVTGVANFDDITKTVSDFNILFDTCVDPNKVIIDNITACGSFEEAARDNASLCKKRCKINLSNVRKLIIKQDEYKDINLSLYPLHFPGLVIRFPNKLPTCVLFSSGKFTIVGAKNADEIHKAYSKLCTVVMNIS